MYLFLSATETKDKCPLNHDQIKTWQPWPRYLEEQGKPISHMETTEKEGDSEWKTNDWCKEIHMFFAAEHLDNK